MASVADDVSFSARLAPSLSNAASSTVRVTRPIASASFADTRWLPMIIACARRMPIRRGRSHDIPPSGLSPPIRSEEHTSELQSPTRLSYALFRLIKKKTSKNTTLQQKIQPILCFYFLKQKQ